MGRFAKIAMAAAAIIVFFMVTAMPGIIRNKNTNQPAAQVEKSTEEDNSQTVQVNKKMKYYLLLERMVAQIKNRYACRCNCFGRDDASKGKIQLISIPRRLELDGKEASEYDWWYQSTTDLWSAIERNFGIKN